MVVSVVKKRQFSAVIRVVSKSKCWVVISVV